MRAQDRASARKNLDKRLILLSSTDALSRPPRGWIKAIREALGMTTAQLGTRLRIAQPSAVGLEKAEESGAISLATLERAAQALGCTLIYALVPAKPLDTMVEERARAAARKRLRTISHSMALEDQRVSDADEHQQLERLAQKLIAESSSALWENE